MDQHLRCTDNEVTAALLTAASNPGNAGHVHARRIVGRKHFKVLYARNPNDVKINPEAGNAVLQALSRQFGAEHFRHDRYYQSTGPPEFPVRLRDGQVVSSLDASATLNQVPVVSVDHVFAERSFLSKGNEWLKANRANIIKPKREADHG